MGYALYEIIRPNGDRIDAGYSVAAICEEDGCDEKINRGFAFLCGKDPRGDEHGCSGYFCEQHLYGDNQCQRCSDAADKTNRWIHPDSGEEFDLRDRFLPAGTRNDARGIVWRYSGIMRDGSPVLEPVLTNGERADGADRLLAEGEWEDVVRVAYRQMHTPAA